jgi:hypothetical protein
MASRNICIFALQSHFFPQNFLLPVRQAAGRRCPPSQHNIAKYKIAVAAAAAAAKESVCANFHAFAILGATFHCWLLGVNKFQI